MSALLKAAKEALAAIELHDRGFYAPEIRALRKAIAEEDSPPALHPIFGNILKDFAGGK